MKKRTASVSKKDAAKERHVKIRDAVASKFEANPWLAAFHQTQRKKAPASPTTTLLRALRKVSAAVLKKTPDMKAVLERVLPFQLGVLPSQLEHLADMVKVADGYIRTLLQENTTLETLSDAYLRTIAPVWFIPPQWLISTKEGPGLIHPDFVEKTDESGKVDVKEAEVRLFLYNLGKGDEETRAKWRSFTFWPEEAITNYLAALDSDKKHLELTDYGLCMGELMHRTHPLTDNAKELAEARDILARAQAKYETKKAEYATQLAAHKLFVKELAEARKSDPGKFQKLNGEAEGRIAKMKESKAELEKKLTNFANAEHNVHVEMETNRNVEEHYQPLQTKLYKRILRAQRSVIPADWKTKEEFKVIGPFFASIYSQGNGSYVHPFLPVIRYDPTNIDANVFTLEDASGQDVVYPAFAGRLYVETYCEAVRLVNEKSKEDRRFRGEAVSDDEDEQQDEDEEGGSEDSSVPRSKAPAASAPKKKPAPPPSVSSSGKERAPVELSQSDDEKEEKEKEEEDYLAKAQAILDEDGEEEEKKKKVVSPKKPTPTPAKAKVVTTPAPSPKVEAAPQPKKKTILKEQVVAAPPPAAAADKKKKPAAVRSLSFDEAEEKEEKPKKKVAVVEEAEDDVDRMILDAEEEAPPPPPKKKVAAPPPPAKAEDKGRKRDKSEISSDEEIKAIKPAAKKAKVEAATPAEKSRVTKADLGTAAPKKTKRSEPEEEDVDDLDALGLADSAKEEADEEEGQDAMELDEEVEKKELTVPSKQKKPEAPVPSKIKASAEPPPAKKSRNDDLPIATPSTDKKKEKKTDDEGEEKEKKKPSKAAAPSLEPSKSLPPSPLKKAVVVTPPPPPAPSQAELELAGVVEKPTLPSSHLEGVLICLPVECFDSFEGLVEDEKGTHARIEEHRKELLRQAHTSDVNVIAQPEVLKPTLTDLRKFVECVDKAEPLNTLTILAAYHLALNLHKTPIAQAEKIRESAAAAVENYEPTFIDYYSDQRFIDRLGVDALRSVGAVQAALVHAQA